MLAHKGAILQFCLSNPDELTSHEIPYVFVMLNCPVRNEDDFDDLEYERVFDRYNVVTSSGEIDVNHVEYELDYPNRPYSRYVTYD